MSVLEQFLARDLHLVPWKGHLFVTRHPACGRDFGEEDSPRPRSQGVYHPWRQHIITALSVFCSCNTTC